MGSLGRAPRRPQAPRYRQKAGYSRCMRPLLMDVHMRTICAGSIKIVTNISSYSCMQCQEKLSCSLVVGGGPGVIEEDTAVAVAVIPAKWPGI